MFKNYFTTIFRQIKRKPGFYLLNIIGLSVGIAAFLLMFEYSYYQFSYDRFHQNAEDIYRVNFDYQLDNRPPYRGAAVFAGVAPAMKQEFPQVAATTRLVSIWGGGGVVRFGDKKQPVAEVQYAESSLFSLFDFPILEGDPGSALDKVHTAMISQPLRERLFEPGKGMGETIEMLTRDGAQRYLVTGVYRVPENSHYTSDMLLSFSSLEQLVGQKLDTQWQWFDYITYVKLRPGTNPAEIEARFPDMIDKYATGRNRNSATVGFELQPVRDIHLRSRLNQEIRPNGDYQTVLFLLIIAILTLSIAWINYINLYTAKVTERGKEVGVRKTLGSTRQQLRIQFLLEAAVINLLAVAIAVYLAYLALTPLQQYLNMVVLAQVFEQREFWFRVLGLWLVGSLLSGAYPAIMISRFEPLKAIRSTGVASSGKMRRLLVIWQFMASAALIVGASTVYHQLSSMNRQSTGMNTDEVLVVTVPQFTGNSQAYHRALSQLKTDYQQYSGVSAVSFASDVPGKQVGWRGSSRLMGTDALTGGLIYKMVIGQDYLSMYDIPLIAGRSFERSSDSLSVILNQKALSLYQFSTAEEALGKRIFFTGVDTLTVVGVVADHYQESLREPLKPTAFLQMEEELMYLFVRLPETLIADFTEYAETRFQEAFPELVFDWQPLATRMANRHRNEDSFLKAFNVFVLLSFLISSLGLIGLAAYLARKRQKEMGLRKVLGSSVNQILKLFFTDFGRLALIGNMLALPVIYYFSNRWLDGFAFRTQFVWWLPLLALLLTVSLACLATLYHVLKVARVNPAKVLSHE